MSRPRGLEVLAIAVMVLVALALAMQLLMPEAGQHWPRGAAPMLLVISAGQLLVLRSSRAGRTPGVRGRLLVGLLAVLALAAYTGSIAEQGLPAAWFELVCAAGVVGMAVTTVASGRRRPTGTPAGERDPD